MTLAAEGINNIKRAIEKEQKKQEVKMTDAELKIADEHLLLKKERANDPGYAQYGQYAY